MLLRKAPVLSAIAMTLAAGGCNPQGDASCLVFQAPEYEVSGADRRSQRWIDSTVERGVAGCNWRRPKLASST